MFKKLLLLFLIVLLIAACSKNKNPKTEEKVAEFVNLAVEEFDSLSIELVGKEVEISGTVVHICKHAGKRLFIIGDNDSIKVKIEAGKVETFPKELEGSVIVAKGTVSELIVDDAYLDNWESEVKTEHEEHELEENSEGEGEDHHSIENTMKQINSLREKAKASEKGYLAYYSIECLEYQEIENEATEEEKVVENAE